MVALDEVTDPVYARGVVGAGLALEPREERCVVHAPIDGTLTGYPHAVMIGADPARAVLVHLGVGAGGPAHAAPLVADGTLVGRADPVLVWEPGRVRAGGEPACAPVVALQAQASQLALVVEPGQDVEVGVPLMFWS